VRTFGGDYAPEGRRMALETSGHPARGGPGRPVTDRRQREPGAGAAGASFVLEHFESGAVIFRVESLERALPGLVAAFTTRRGGVGPPPWDSLNLGRHVGDDPRAVDENRRRVFAGLGLDPKSLVTAQQVHGDRVAAAGAPGRHPATDGLVTDVPGLTLAVFCADCTPVFLVDPTRPAAGVVHAGWRGTVAGIAARAVAEMTARYGSRPVDLVAAVGPSIGPCCYEVGPEVSDAARRRLGAGVLVPGPGPRPHLDLWEANRRVLVEAGLAPERVHVAGLCTSCLEDLFYSHRRETVRAGRPSRTGRMAALVCLPEKVSP